MPRAPGGTRVAVTAVNPATTTAVAAIFEQARLIRHATE